MAKQLDLDTTISDEELDEAFSDVPLDEKNGEKSMPRDIIPVKESTEVILPITSISPEELESNLVIEKKKREIITRYVKEQLIEGIDYGKIEMTSKKTGKTWTSKPTLFKPGMEKIHSLLSVQSVLTKDEETLGMLDVPNVIAYKCVLTRNGQVLSEGRGSSSVNENDGDVNKTIKIAEKRARMDACLSLGFSEFFTQDLDDMPSNSINSDLASEKQHEFISKLLYKANEEQKKFITERGDKLTKAEASKIIDTLNKPLVDDQGEEKPF